MTNVERIAAYITISYAVIVIGSLTLSVVGVLPEMISDIYAFVDAHVPYFDNILISVLVGSLAFLYGRRSARRSNGSTTRINRVPGCIMESGVCWRGEIVLKPRQAKWSFTFVENPICPDCQTPLIDVGRSSTSPSYGPSDMICPKGHVETTYQSRELIESHRNVLKTHLERIIESDGEYSLKTLEAEYRSGHEDSPTGEDIWELYVEKKGDSELSTDCFY